MLRKEANMQIVRLLVNAINMYPDMRFGQLIQYLRLIQREEVNGKLHLVDNFYEESEETLKRMTKEMAGLV